RALLAFVLRAEGLPPSLCAPAPAPPYCENVPTAGDVVVDERITPAAAGVQVFPAKGRDQAEPAARERRPDRPRGVVRHPAVALVEEMVVVALLVPGLHLDREPVGQDRLVQLDLLDHLLVPALEAAHGAGQRHA